jgi:protocatechuate 3,4-dioxygenase alpha subunit
MAEEPDRAPTPSQTIGPFFGFALPFSGGADAGGGVGGDAVRIEGRVLDGDGRPVVDALLEVWHGESFARCGTDASGSYRVTVPKPAARSGARHLEVTIFARGLLRQLATRIYFPEEGAANAADPVLARVDPDRRATLIARGDGDALRFDVHLQGPAETVFFAL